MPKDHHNHLHPVSSSEPINLGDYGALTDSLMPHELGPEELFIKAQELLDHAGQETIVNGMTSIATPQSVELELEGSPLFARLATTTINGEPTKLPTIIFCKDDDFKSIRTQNGYFGALEFNGRAGVHLIAGEGDALETDDPKHLELTRTIIERISDDFIETQEENQRTILENEAAHHAKNEAQTRHEANVRAQRLERISYFAKRAGGAFVAFALFWAPQLVDSHPDATIGAVPMPLPIEWVVDWNNHVDHVAQGFAEPKGVLAVGIDQKVGSIPLIADYDTQNVPDASVTESNGIADASKGKRSNDNGIYEGEQSRPGLYQSDFDFGQHSESALTAEFNKSGYYDIKGDFTDGKTVIFTQTPGLNKMVRVEVIDATTLRVYKKLDAPKNSKGSVFIYQKPEKEDILGF